VTLVPQAKRKSPRRSAFRQNTGDSLPAEQVRGPPVGNRAQQLERGSRHHLPLAERVAQLTIAERRRFAHGSNVTRTEHPRRGRASDYDPKDGD